MFLFEHAVLLSAENETESVSVCSLISAGACLVFTDMQMLCHGKHNSKRCSFTRNRLCGNGTVMGSDNLPADCKAKTGSVLFVSHKKVEQSRQIFFRNTATGVFYFNGDKIAVTGQADMNRAAVRHRL